jgi:hypothetical protein
LNDDVGDEHFIQRRYRVDVDHPAAAERGVGRAARKVVAAQDVVKEAAADREAPADCVDLVVVHRQLPHKPAAGRDAVAAAEAGAAVELAPRGEPGEHPGAVRLLPAGD